MTNKQMNELWEIFKELGADGLVMNHYSLAAETRIKDSQLWKEFLMNPEVADWIKSEFTILQESELRKMIKDISTSKSVGQAQLMNTLDKLNKDRSVKEGPIFIYSYVPLSPEQNQAENIQILESDPFLKGGK